MKHLNRLLAVLTAAILFIASAPAVRAAPIALNRSAERLLSLSEEVASVEDIDVDALTAAVRSALKERKKEVSFRFHMDVRFTTQEAADNWVEEAAAWHERNAMKIPALAMRHTGSPTEGDYLLYQMGNYGVGYELDVGGDGGFYRLYFTFDLFTDAAQEDAVTARLTEVMSSLRLSGLSEAEKAAAIHDWICRNVAYDDAHRNSSTYNRQYTAYAALMDGRAVCQGYAALFYRMALMAGLDARVISGTGYGNTERTDGGSHAWNIVRVGGKYYNVDCTWDAGVASYQWLLRGKGEFDRTHQRENNDREEYASAAFASAYPMAASDFELSPVKITVWKNPFLDVKPEDVWYDAVRYVNEAGLFLGVSDTSFAPEGAMTRAMFVTVLGRLAGASGSGKPSAFTDVEPGLWYSDYVDWAAERGIVEGYGDGRFGPGDTVTREQAAVILARYAKSRGTSLASSSPLPGGVSPWAAEAAAWAVSSGIWPADEAAGGALRPGEYASRAFVARMLARFAELGI